MKSTLQKLQKLKQEKDAIILAHYYQSEEIQELADHVGDSYYLSKIGKEAKEERIVLCGVRFMAESAKILSPQKTVLLANRDAGCPMADMADINQINKLKNQHPDAAVVCYINTPVEVKAVSDVCVTSSNAYKIVEQLPQRKIIFLPDQNLAAYVASLCPDKEIIPYSGFCIVHHQMMAEEVLELKEKHPKALVLSHPENRKEVLDISDYVGSTLGIIQYAHASSEKEFIIITEEGIRYQLKKQNPDKSFYFSNKPSMICRNMKKTTIENVLETLETDENQIVIDEDIRLRALRCLERMHTEIE